MSGSNTDRLVDLTDGELVAIRQRFGPAFLELADADPKLVAVTADLGSSVGLAAFSESHPEQYFNVGVAEQNMIGVSAGLAMRGYKPFAITFGSFLGRAIDHVRQSIGHNGINVNVVGSHGGISNGSDGPSAHAIEDIAIFRAMPSFAVVVIADANQLGSALKAIVEYPDPVYVRLYREPTPLLYAADEPFDIGRAKVVRPGNDVTIVACGPHVSFCAKWAEAWSSEFSTEVIDCHTIRPIDGDAVIASAAKTGRVVTVEDHFINGGLGSAVAEVLSERHPTPLQRVGLRDYGTSGPYYELIEHVGIGERATLEAVRRLLK
jgi:transketolase